MNFTTSAVEVLAALTERCRQEAPSYIMMSDRAVLEALIHYADRENLSFEELFNVTADSAK